MAAHVLACGSILFFRHFEPTNEISRQQDVTGVYEVTVYFLITCFSTVGFGDITPTALETRLFSILIMLWSIYLNVYILSAGLAPALRRGVVEERMKTKKANLAGLLDFYRVPWEIQKQVREREAVRWCGLAYPPPPSPPCESTAPCQSNSWCCFRDFWTATGWARLRERGGVGLPRPVRTGHHQDTGGVGPATERRWAEGGVGVPRRSRGPGCGARQGQLRGNLSSWSGSFYCTKYTKGEAKGDGMRPHRILSLW